MDSQHLWPKSKIFGIEILHYSIPEDASPSRLLSRPPHDWQHGSKATCGTPEYNAENWIGFKLIAN